MADAVINVFPVVPYTNFFRPRIGTILTDADTTVVPQTEAMGLYILPANTLTANRVLTFTNAGSTATQIFGVLRLDAGAFTYTMRNSVPTTLYTAAASPTVPVLYMFYNSGGTWIANTFQYVQLT